MLCLTTVVLLVLVVVAIKDDAVVSSLLHRFFYTTSRYSTLETLESPFSVSAFVLILQVEPALSYALGTVRSTVWSLQQWKVLPPMRKLAKLPESS